MYCVQEELKSELDSERRRGVGQEWLKQGMYKRAAKEEIANLKAEVATMNLALQVQHIIDEQ